MKHFFVFRWFSSPFRYAFAKLKKKLGKLDRLKLEIFLVIGNGRKVFVKGRVVEAYRQSRPSDKKTALQNLLAMLRRYAGSSVPDATIRLAYGSHQAELITDSEGLFEKMLRFSDAESQAVQTIRFSLVPEQGLVPETGWVERSVHWIRKPYPRAVISDIDDTVIISKATNIGEKLWLSVSKNAYTRRPFPGVSEFYQLLTANGEYPVFYVSSSDWNLFDLIRDFLAYRNIPLGPILLKDGHINLKNIWKSGGGNHAHKLEKIEFLLEFFPEQRVLLIGDSGQHDPELYAEIIRRFPDRVEAVYIRKVRQGDAAREHELNQLLPPNKVAWVKTTREALLHAQEHLVV